MKTLLAITLALVTTTASALGGFPDVREFYYTNPSFNTNSNKNSNWNENRNYNDSEANNSMTVNEAAAPDKVTIKNTPGVVGPALTTSNGTCMGSTSIGGSGPGISATFGTTWKDNSCNLRYNAQIIHNMGYETEALAVMCQEPTVAKAAPLLCNFILDETQSKTVNKPAVEVKPTSNNGFF